MIRIDSNGSKWAGEQPDSLGKLLDMLATEPLDPSMEYEGHFFHLAHGCVDGGIDPVTYKRIYHDTGPLYPEHPYTVRFFGNFANRSHVFNIDTDDAEVIEVLASAIEANMARPDYIKRRNKVKPLKAVRS